MPTVVKFPLAVQTLVAIQYGPRKRLFPKFPFEFQPGNVLRVHETGETMLVQRADDRGVLVKRALGAARAAPIPKGAHVVRIAWGSTSF